MIINRILLCAEDMGYRPVFEGWAGFEVWESPDGLRVLVVGFTNGRVWAQESWRDRRLPPLSDVHAGGARP